MTSVYHPRDATYGRVLPSGHTRPLPEIKDGLPVYSWPSQATRVPGECPREHCNGRLYGDIPTLTELQTDLTCMLCSRVVGKLVSDAARPRLTNAEVWALPIQQPQRPRKPQPDRCPKRTVPCPVCRTREIQPHRAKCADCERARRTEHALPTRLVAALGDGRRLTTEELGEALGCSIDSVRQAVKKARMAGHRVVLERTQYRQDGQARLVVARPCYRLERTP
jgi:hypothetical protein